MSGTAVVDDRGRTVIPHEVRERHGDRYRVVGLGDRVELIPLADDSIEGVRGPSVTLSTEHRSWKSNEGPAKAHWRTP